ncbi:sensor histidine kinase [beta proteobacterium MWH-UniP1]
MSAAPFAQADGPLRAGETTHTLGPAELSVLRDPSRSLTIETIASAAYAPKFQPAINGLNFGYTNDALWVRVALSRERFAYADWLIRYNTSYIDDFRFYLPTADGFREMQAGDKFPYLIRNYPHRTPVFPVSLKDEQHNVFYIRLQGDSTLTGSLLLYTPEAFLQGIQKENLLIGALLAMALITTLVNLNSFFWSRNRQFLGLSALGVLLISGSMAQLGLWSQIVFQNTPWVGDNLVPWTVGVFVASVLWVFRGPLAINQHYPIIDRLLRGIAAVALLAPLTRYFGVYATVGGPFIMMSLITGVSIIGWIAFRNFRVGMEGANYFLVGFLIFSVSYFIAPMIALGWIAPIPFYEYVWIAGTVGFLFLAYQGAISEVRRAIVERRRSETLAQSAMQLANQEQALRKEQTLFFAGVAHDLRTPLAAISMGLTNLIKDIGAVNPQSQERIDRLRMTSKRMADMIERHLQLQRLTHADFQLNRQPVNPREIALGALAVVEDAWPLRRFENRFDPAIPSLVSLDGELIELALVNLLTNAAKYSPEQSPVQLLVQMTDEQLCFSVIDYGSGVPDNEVDRLFKIYWRSPSGGAEQAGKEGFGIGLATVRRIAELHQGRASYHRTVHEGRSLSEFRLEIPL